MKDDIDDIDFDSIGVGFDHSGDEQASVREVFGGQGVNEDDESNFASKLGKPITEGEKVRYYFFPTWRSQCLNLIGYFFLCILGIVVSRYVPALVMKGSLFSLGSTVYFLHLPVVILLPGFVLGKILINMYDAKFIIDDRGVESQVGLVSLTLRQPRLRWEDIRGVEATQTIWERLLGIGTVLVGSAMTQDVEIIMSGVANPRAIQLLIGAERDRRLAEITGSDSNNIAAKHASGLIGD